METSCQLETHTREPASTEAAAAPGAALVCPLAALAAVTVAWAVLFMVIPPGRQDFPLNDDWAFAKGAFAFAEGEGIHYQRWASMPQLGQWLWAWPLVEIFGESHAALRFSTVVLSLLSVLAFFDLLGQAGLSPARAAFVAACFGLNPLYFLLSGTFLTDVPSLAFCQVSTAAAPRRTNIISRMVFSPSATIVSKDTTKSAPTIRGASAAAT